jgi:hypothetical protein
MLPETHHTIFRTMGRHTFCLTIYSGVEKYAMRNAMAVAIAVASASVSVRKEVVEASPLVFALGLLGLCHLAFHKVGS